MLGITGAMLAVVAFSGSVMAADVPNGGFEGTLNDGGAGYQLLSAGSSGLGPWTITGSVDWISHHWPAAQGSNNSIDLNGLEAGTISQTIPTTAGKTYVVEFQLAGNPWYWTPATKTLTVEATGTDPSSYSFDTTGKWLDNMGWRAEGYSFKATSATTTITFASTTPGEYGPALDGVVVSELVTTPTPTAPDGADCKDDGWRKMSNTSTGIAFKNQGACVSFYAKSK